MVVSSRTITAFAVSGGLVGILVALAVGGYVYRQVFPTHELEVCCIEDLGERDFQIVPFLGWAIILGTFGAGICSLINDNREVKLGSGAGPLVPTSHPVAGNIREDETVIETLADRMRIVSSGTRHSLIAAAISAGCFIAAALVYWFNLPDADSSFPIEFPAPWTVADYVVLGLTMAGAGCAIAAVKLYLSTDDAG